LAAPYARWLHGSTLTVGLLMAAMPLGMVIGALLLGRVAAPSARIRIMGWLTVLSCAPLTAVRGALRCGPFFRCGCWQVRPAQSGLYAVRRIGILADGAARQAIGAPLAVGLAGLVGVTAATMLAMSWTHLRGRLIHAQRGEAETMGA
jgi:hypothetical protein